MIDPYEGAHSVEVLGVVSKMFVKLIRENVAATGYCSDLKSFLPSSASA